MLMLDISKQRLNYDKIAHLYDEPLRDYRVDPNLLAFLQQWEDGRTGLRVLDLGCGTGKQLTADSQALSGIQFVGLDLFSGMLRVARERGPGINWLQGDSANPPFAPNSFDYITNQFSYQHVQQKEKLIQAFYRLLKPGGRFVLNNIDPWQMTGWVIYQFFPAAWELDARDFFTTEQFVDLMKTARFQRIEVNHQKMTIELTLAEVYDYVSTRSRTSQFMAISDDDYAAGVQKVKESLAQQGGEATIESAFCFLTISGDKS
jgi:ubiquinone/menaquinone biosynthesis C-methylase UbiE